MANGMLMSDLSVRHKSWYRLLRQELQRRRKLRRKEQKAIGDEGDSDLILPVELVEKILARVPFPDVFKGRVLSRSWRRKFSLVSQHLRSPCPLLNEISSAAVGWPTFCPVYMTPAGGLMGYSHTSLSWEKLVISAYIPMNRTFSNLVAARRIEFGGPFICIYEARVPFYRTGLSMFELFMANIQTGSWKTIVCPKQLETSENPQVVLLNEPGSEEYRILVYDVRRPYVMDILGGIEFEVHLFDSASRTWTSKQTSYIEGGRFISSYCTCSRQINIDGNIYLMGPGVTEDPRDLSMRHILHVIKYNMVDDVWSKSTTSVQLKNHEVYDVGGLFLCGSKLLLILLDKGREMDGFSVRPLDRENGEDFRRKKGRSDKHGACAYEVCPETLGIELLSVSPIGIFGGICRSMMSDDNNVYFFCSNCPGRTKAVVVRYNVSEQSWDRLASPPTEICRNTIWARSAYVPGQNPFAMV